jgi:hypothetical protein
VSCILDVGRTSGDRHKVDAVLTSKGGPKKVPTINEQEVFVLADYIREFTGQSDAQSKKMCDLLELLAPFQRELITGSDDGKVQPCFEMQAAKKVDGPTPPAPGSDSSVYFDSLVGHPLHMLAFDIYKIVEQCVRLQHFL